MTMTQDKMIKVIVFTMLAVAVGAAIFSGVFGHSWAYPS